MISQQRLLYSIYFSLSDYVVESRKLLNGRQIFFSLPHVNSTKGTS